MESWEKEEAPLRRVGGSFCVGWGGCCCWWWRYGVEANVLQFDGFPSRRGDYNLAGLELKGFDVSHEVGKLYGVGLYGLGGALESTGVTVAALSSTWRLRGAQVSFWEGLSTLRLPGFSARGASLVPEGAAWGCRWPCWGI